LRGSQFSVSSPWRGCPWCWLVFAVCLTLLTFAVALFWQPLAFAVGKRSDFGATFRVLAYTSVIYALGSLVPFVGPLVAVFFGVFFSGGIVVRDVHRTSTPLAMLAVALPWVLYLVLKLALVLSGRRGIAQSFFWRNSQSRIPRK
jgi:hypothetical protein